MDYYVVEKGGKVRGASMTEFIEWTTKCDAINHGKFEDGGKRVARTHVSDDVFVSTVFLGMDHGWDRGRPDYQPVLFETMVFGLPDEDEYQERYSTVEEALAGHDRAVAWAKSKLPRRNLLTSILSRLNAIWRYFVPGAQ